MSMTTELAQRMKAAALKATPGEWVYLPSNTSIEYDYGSDDSQGSITYMDSGDFTQKQTELNGIFIALANPANVLALVDALEARDLTLSARDYHYDQQADRIQSLEKALEAAAQNSDGVAGMAEHYETTISMLKSRIAELERFKAAFTEWLDKTEWVQTDKRFDVVKPWGKHRAEVLKLYIEHLQTKLETADKLQDSAFRHGLQHGFSLGQTDNQAGFEQCMTAYRQKEKNNG